VPVDVTFGTRSVVEWRADRGTLAAPQLAHAGVAAPDARARSCSSAGRERRGASHRERVSDCETADSSVVSAGRLARRTDRGELPPPANIRRPTSRTSPFSWIRSFLSGESNDSPTDTRGDRRAEASASSRIRVIELTHFSRGTR